MEEVQSALNPVVQEPQLTWDYTGYKKDGEPVPSFYVQSYWNQTLMTMINRASLLVQKEALRRANVIKVSPKVHQIISDFMFYNGEHQMLSGRYKVIVDDTLTDDVVEVFYDEEINTIKKITVLNYAD